MISKKNIYLKKKKSRTENTEHEIKGICIPLKRERIEDKLKTQLIRLFSLIKITPL
jgi:hypothetical protein